MIFVYLRVLLLDETDSLRFLILILEERVGLPGRKP
jgi:hypothetical protein